ncbi:MAG: type III-A CRISPR-associated RAMP protein Csm3 [Selenomonadaceae bacterium]|nr:type III-A CRISPR-associated RAMP protein Csm3 [Selenomonadaceae bacterium]MBR3721344.1 type III-A CRISPR-associated RAMP protein Csm3 [Selenomonadaceae bacterium]
MYGKIQITGQITVKTGMHIGGSDAFAAIGAVDSPVIRDVRTGQPMLPGSSLKGKIRSLLARKYNEQPVNHDDDALIIKRLFGSAKKGEDKVLNSRLIFSDMFLDKALLENLKKQGLLGATEIKFENTINRLTAVANPRQIERVIRGVKFNLDIIYDIYNMDNPKEIEDDFALLAEGMKLLEYDYLGGHGSRGYGKVEFSDLEASLVVGDIDDELMDKIKALLSGGKG